MTLENIIKDLNLGKKIYVNGFDWQVKKQGLDYIIQNNDGIVFCPLLNDSKQLILKDAQYKSID